KVSFRIHRQPYSINLLPTVHFNPGTIRVAKVRMIKTNLISHGKAISGTVHLSVTLHDLQAVQVGYVLTAQSQEVAVPVLELAEHRTVPKQHDIPGSEWVSYLNAWRAPPGVTHNGVAQVCSFD